MKIHVTVPERVMDEVADNLVMLTREIDKRDPERTAHGFLGGEHGYGADYENNVFVMRPYYWGDCTCGYDEHEREWCSTHDHGPKCYQTEVRGRMAVYDLQSGYEALDAEVFGGNRVFGGMDVDAKSPAPGVTTMLMTPRKDETMERWRAANKAREKVENALYDELCAKYGLDRKLGCAVHCTCSYRTEWIEWGKNNDHAADCLLILPNFKHKASGLTVEWYKYIGRSMEAENVPESIDALNAIFRECIASLPPHSTRSDS